MVQYSNPVGKKIRRHNKGKQISFEKLKAKRLLCGDKSEAAGKRDQEQRPKGCRSEEYCGRTAIAHNKHDDEAGCGHIVSFFQGPKKLPDIKVDEKNTQTYAQIQRKDKDIG